MWAARGPHGTELLLDDREHVTGREHQVLLARVLDLGAAVLAVQHHVADLDVDGNAGAKRVPVDVKVGDVVLYSKYGGTEVKYSGEEYLVLSARDVLAIIEK